MKRLTTIVTLLLLTFLLTFCDSATDPVEIEPGSRDYNWDIDTLPRESGNQMRMWASSSDNIWIAGTGLEPEYKIWHYNGEGWRPESHPGMSDIWALWGYDETEVWAGSRDGVFWRYTPETGWLILKKFSTGEKRYVIQDINGYSKKEFYAVGTLFGTTDDEMGFIVHFKDNKWKIEHYDHLDTAFRKITKSKDGKYFIKGSKPSNIKDNYVRVFKFDGINLTKIYEEVYSKYTWVRNEEINNRTIFHIGYNICIYENGKFITLHENDPDSNLFGYLNGNSSKDIFLEALDGIVHYNGVDTKYLIDFEDGEYHYLKESVHFGDESFFLVENVNKSINIIVHGKLQK